MLLFKIMTVFSYRRGRCLLKRKEAMRGKACAGNAAIVINVSKSMAKILNISASLALSSQMASRSRYLCAAAGIGSGCGIRDEGESGYFFVMANMYFYLSLLTSMNIAQRISVMYPAGTLIQYNNALNNLQQHQ